VRGWGYGRGLSRNCRFLLTRRCRNVLFVGMKIKCSHCEIEKDETLFHSWRTLADQDSPVCKDCHARYARTARLKKGHRPLRLPSAKGKKR
jgi:hypothetical protein